MSESVWKISLGATTVSFVVPLWNCEVCEQQVEAPDVREHAILHLGVTPSGRCSACSGVVFGDAKSCLRCRILTRRRVSKHRQMAKTSATALQTKRAWPVFDDHNEIIGYITTENSPDFERLSELARSSFGVNVRLHTERVVVPNSDCIVVKEEKQV